MWSHLLVRHHRFLFILVTGKPDDTQSIFSKCDICIKRALKTSFDKFICLILGGILWVTNTYSCFKSERPHMDLYDIINNQNIIFYPCAKLLYWNCRLKSFFEENPFSLFNFPCSLYMSFFICNLNEGCYLVTRANKM